MSLPIVDFSTLNHKIVSVKPYYMSVRKTFKYKTFTPIINYIILMLAHYILQNY